MRLSESFTINNYRIEMSKEGAREMHIEVTKTGHMDDDDRVLYRGNLQGYRDFVAMHETFLGHANKFHALEVPRI